MRSTLASIDLVFRASAVVVALFGASASTVRAELILGNLAGSNDFNAVALYDTSNKAVSFTMGAQSYWLDASVLRLNFATGSPIIELRNDVGGADPGGTVLAAFTTPDVNGGGIQSYAFTPTAATMLQANTKYWLYAYGSGDDFSEAALWYRSNPDIEPAGGGATFNAYRLTNDGGGSWAPNSAFNSFELQGTPVAVPEPSSLALVGALTLLAGVRRRRRGR